VDHEALLVVTLKRFITQQSCRPLVTWLTKPSLFHKNSCELSSLWWKKEFEVETGFSTMRIRITNENLSLIFLDNILYSIKK
jgi:hypothetical protein